VGNPAYVSFSNAAKPQRAIWGLEAVLRLGALITVPAGDKFVFVVPPSQVNGLPSSIRRDN